MVHSASTIDFVLIPKLFMPFITDYNGILRHSRAVLPAKIPENPLFSKIKNNNPAENGGVEQFFKSNYCWSCFIAA